MIHTLCETGIYHKDRGKRNQDSVSSGKKGRYSVISLADGVSSCRYADEGAVIASSAITNLLLKNAKFFFEEDKAKIAELALSHIKHELREISQECGNDIEEYSSTVASILYDQKSKRLLFFSLGDSLILACKSGKCGILVRPSDSSNGCFVTTTVNADKMVRTGVIDGQKYDSVVILSDGAWKNILDNNRIDSRVKAFVEEGRYDQLSDYLLSQDCADDFSFVSIYFNRCAQRRIAS